MILKINFLINFLDVLTRDIGKEKLCTERKNFITLDLNLNSEKENDFETFNFPLQYMISQINYDTQGKTKFI